MPHNNLEDELCRFNKLTDPGFVNRKRAAYKGHLVKFLSQVDSLVRPTAKILKHHKINKKFTEINRTYSLFDASQERHLELPASREDFNSDAEQDSGDAT